MVQKEGGEKMICQGCGQEFTPMPRSESKTLCPKCFIKKLDGLIANNPGNPGDDPAQNKTMDQPIDPKQPEPTAPDAPAESPVTPPTGEEPAEEGPAAPPGAPAPGVTPQPGEEKKEEGEGTPPPVA